MRGYGHIDDMLADSSSAELSGWYEYAQREDEHMVHLIARAILLAFNGESNTSTPQREMQKEEIIDTTDPNFAKQFQGFTGGAQQPATPKTQQGAYQIIDG